MVHRPCFGPDGFQSTTETAPDGVPMWQHVVARRDGGPGLTLGPDGRFVEEQARAIPSAPDPQDQGAFAAVTGIWALDGAGQDHAAGLLPKAPR